MVVHIVVLVIIDPIGLIVVDLGVPRHVAIAAHAGAALLGESLFTKTAMIDVPRVIVVELMPVILAKVDGIIG